jgi:glycosyltransferase involved in cell wall biosynthesis
MREDKGINRLPAILELIPAALRAKFSLSFAGSGNCGKMVADTARLVDVTKEPASKFLSDIEIARELARSDVLLAPYPLVSASGSVVLGLSRGLRVIAYDTGALSEVVDTDGLVEPGNETAFAERIVAAARFQCGRPAHALAEWRAASLCAWRNIILALTV